MRGTSGFPSRVGGRVDRGAPSGAAIRTAWRRSTRYTSGTGSHAHNRGYSTGNSWYVSLYTTDTTRELFWRTSPDGETWSSPSKLVGIDGHYQISHAHEGTFVTAFNWHPDGDADRRTNLYALQTTDHGRTWQTLDGTTVDPPLVDPANEALVVNYEPRDRLVYLNDVTFDPGGNPIVLYVTSGGYEPAPANDPRRWKVTHWNGGEWQTCTVTESDHNYGSGSIYASDDGWTVAGPTETGPQPYYTGGEMAVWKSADRGRNWVRTHLFPSRDGRNATYARRPRNATAPFEVFWTDGDPSQFSSSRLYFGSLEGGTGSFRTAWTGTPRHPSTSRSGASDRLLRFRRPVWVEETTVPPCPVAMAVTVAVRSFETI